MIAGVDIGRAVLATLICGALSLGVLAAFRVPAFPRPALAILRGGVQLGLLSLVLTGVISDARWVAGFLAAMYVFAVITVTGRLGRDARTVAAVSGAIGIAVLLSGVVVFGTGAVPWTSRYLLAVGGILIGGAMTVAAVTGRAFRSTVEDRWDQVEGWLALGARPRQATIAIAREAAFTGLVPLTDQTRTTGLVVLPGAFIGAVFGGLSPLEAGVFQITVLAALVASGSIVAVLLLGIVGPRLRKPMDA